MVAFADNACGNLFDKAEVTVNNQHLSTIQQGLPQASALRSRLGSSNAWLKSLGSPELHDANFPKRVMASASNAINLGNAPNPSFSTDNEMFKPLPTAHFRPQQFQLALSVSQLRLFWQQPFKVAQAPRWSQRLLMQLRGSQLVQL